MRPTTFALPLALLASLVTASPLAIGAAKRESVPVEGIPIGAVRAVDEGSKRTTGMSKYSDFNGLTERNRAYTLHVCVAQKCGGPCTPYALDVAHHQCFDTVQFQSAYVLYFGPATLGFTVYAGEECNPGSRSSHTPQSMSDILHPGGTVLSHVNYCYNVIGDSYIIS